MAMIQRLEMFPTPAEEARMEKHAKRLINAEMLPDTYVWKVKPGYIDGQLVESTGTPYPVEVLLDRVVCVMLKCWELKIPYTIGIERMFPVKGEIKMYADLALYLIQRNAHADVRFTHMGFDKVVIKHARPTRFVNGFWQYPPLEEYSEVEYTMKEAQYSGKWLRDKTELTKSQLKSPWYRYPITMLIWKAVNKLGMAYQQELKGVRVEYPEGDWIEPKVIDLPVPDEPEPLPPEEAAPLLDDTEDVEEMEEAEFEEIMEEIEEEAVPKPPQPTFPKRKKVKLPTKPKPTPAKPAKPSLAVKNGKPTLTIRSASLKRRLPKKKEEEIIEEGDALLEEETDSDKTQILKKPLKLPIAKKTSKKASKKKSKKKTSRKKALAQAKAGKVDLRGVDEYFATRNKRNAKHDYPLAVLSSTIAKLAEKSGQFTFDDVKAHYDHNLKSKKPTESLVSLMLDSAQSILETKLITDKAFDPQPIWEGYMDKVILAIVKQIDEKLLSYEKPSTTFDSLYEFIIEICPAWKDQVAWVSWAIDYLKDRGVIVQDDNMITAGGALAELTMT